LAVETVSVNSAKATPLEGYYACKSQTVRTIGLTLEAETIVLEHGVLETVKIKLEGKTS
jgi:hypothetical protein